MDSKKIMHEDKYGYVHIEDIHAPNNFSLAQKKSLIPIVNTSVIISHRVDIDYDLAMKQTKSDSEKFCRLRTGC